MSKKLCKDTEIKAFSHWHFEFSMARFWAVPNFSNKVWTVWNAYTTADYPARPGQPHGQTYQHNLSPLDDGEIFLYSLSWLVGLRNRCCIKGLGKNPQKEWARSLFTVPFVRGLPSVTRWTPRKWYVCQSSRDFYNNAAKRVYHTNTNSQHKLLHTYHMFVSAN